MKDEAKPMDAHAALRELATFSCDSQGQPFCDCPSCCARAAVAKMDAATPVARAAPANGEEVEERTELGRRLESRMVDLRDALQADELERLRSWKAEASAVLDEWEATWEAFGRPGKLGESKAKAVAALARRPTPTPAAANGGEVEVFNRCLAAIQTQRQRHGNEQWFDGRDWCERRITKLRDIALARHAPPASGDHPTLEDRYKYALTYVLNDAAKRTIDERVEALQRENERLRTALETIRDKYKGKPVVGCACCITARRALDGERT